MIDVHTGLPLGAGDAGTLTAGERGEVGWIEGDEAPLEVRSVSVNSGVGVRVGVPPWDHALASAVLVGGASLCLATQLDEPTTSSNYITQYCPERLVYGQYPPTGWDRGGGNFCSAGSGRHRVFCVLSSDGTAHQCVAGYGWTKRLANDDERLFDLGHAAATNSSALTPFLAPNFQTSCRSRQRPSNLHDTRR